MKVTLLSNAIKIGLKKFDYVFEAPNSIGTTPKHRVAVLMLYIFCAVISICMIYWVLNNDAVFTDVRIMQKGSDIQFPSILVCPEKSKLYDYSFIYDDKLDEMGWYGLTVSEVNFIAKSHYEGHIYTLTSTGNSSRQVFRGYLKDQVWEDIALESWDMWKTHWDDYIPSWEMAISCSNKGVKMHSCSYWEGDYRWLKDKSFCIFWSGKSVKLGKNQEFGTRIAINLKNQSQSYRVWVGYNETEEIDFWHLTPEVKSVDISMEIVMYNETAISVCQPLLDDHCKKEEIPQVWKTLTKYVPVTEYGFNSIKITIPSPATFLAIKSVNRFTNYRFIEVSGNLLSIWSGLSVLTVIRGFLAIVHSKKTLKPQLGLSIEMIAVLMLAIGIGLMQYQDYSQLQEARYVTETGIQDRTGSHYPTISICPKFNTIYNVTIIEKLNISYPLLKYITGTAMLSLMNNYADYNAHNPKDNYFLIDRDAPAELGFHYNFLEFPIQTINKKLYEKYMQKIENEYEGLCKKLEISHEAPSWKVLKKITLDPCRMINSCRINGENYEDCCHNMKYKLHIDPEVLFCYEFPRNDKFKQTTVGPEFGFEIRYNVDELKNSMQKLWYDSYIKQYIQTCRNITDCSVEQPTPGDPVITTFVNNGSDLVTFNHINSDNPNAINYGMITNIALTLISQSQVDSPLSGNCSDDVTQSFESENNAVHYYKQEIIFNQCGCYACYDESMTTPYKSQITPCCTPKVLGRCITSDNMYFDHPCGKSKKLSARYAGNLPKYAYYNQFLIQCSGNVFKLVTDDDSPLRLQQSVKPREYWNVPPCHVDNVIAVKDTPFFNEDKTEKKLFVQNFYYPTVFHIQTKENDLENPWELLSLFAGTLSAAYGVSLFAICSALLLFFWKIYRLVFQVESLNSVLTYLQVYGLNRFSSRFKSLIIRENDEKDEDELISGRNENSSQLAENKAMTEKLGGNSAKVVQSVEIEKSKPAEIEIQHMKNSGWTSETKSNFTHSTAHFCLTYLFLSLAIAGWLYCTIQLYHSMQLDETKTTFEFRKEGISPPSLAVCSERSTITKHPTMAVYNPTNSLKDCKIGSKSWDCKNFFVKILRNKDQDCIFSFINESFAADVVNNDFIVTLEGKHFIWLGDTKTIDKSHMTADHLIQPGENLHIGYEEWEAIEEASCSGTSLNTTTCPLCQSDDLRQQNENAMLCCLKPNLDVSSMMRKSFSHCMVSHYFKRIVPSTAVQEHSILTMTATIKVKKVITKTARRTISEQFMLYAGYVGLLIGINIVNIIYVVAFQTLMNLMEWIKSKKS